MQVCKIVGRKSVAPSAVCKPYASSGVNSHMPDYLGTLPPGDADYSAQHLAAGGGTLFRPPILNSETLPHVVANQVYRREYHFVFNPFVDPELVRKIGEFPVVLLVGGPQQ